MCWLYSIVTHQLAPFFPMMRIIVGPLLRFASRDEPSKNLDSAIPGKLKYYDFARCWKDARKGCDIDLVGDQDGCIAGR